VREERSLGLLCGPDPGGEINASTKVIEETLDATGAVVMGRRMFSGGEGPWENDPNAGGWWGDDPPFHVPVFVLTNHAREAVAMEGGTTFTFVTEGIGAALEQAGVITAATPERNWTTKAIKNLLHCQPTLTTITDTRTDSTRGAQR